MIDAAAKFTLDTQEQYKMTRTAGQVAVSRFSPRMNKWEEVSEKEVPAELQVIYRTFKSWDAPMMELSKAA